MRKGMKLLAAVTAATVVSSMSMSAFGLSYSTSTEYKDDKVSVKTTVMLDANDKKNDEIAYLVYEGDDAKAKDAIKYIDQKNANGADSVSFEWTTTELDIDAKAYVATTNIAAADDAETINKNVVKLDGYDVTYTVNGNGIVVLDEDVTDELEIAEDATTATSAKLEDTAVAVFRVYPEPGFAFGGVEGANGDAVDATVTNEGNLVTVVFKSADPVTFKFVEASGDVAFSAEADDTAKAGEVSKFATATGAITEAGILVAPNATAASEIEKITSLAAAKEKGIYVMKAHLIGDAGKYIVTVKNGAIEDGAAVSAYAVDAEGNLYIEH